MLEKSRLWLVRLLESWPHWENESHAWSRCKRRRRHRGSEWRRRPAGGLEQHSTYPDTAAGGGLCLLHPYYLRLHLERRRDREEKRQNSGLNADGERASQPFLRFFFKKQTNKQNQKTVGTERAPDFGSCALGNLLLKSNYFPPNLPSSNMSA